MERIAVITGDVVNFSSETNRVQKDIEEAITTVLREYEEDIFRDSENYLIYRGDSFQIVTTALEESLKISIRLRLAVRKHFSEQDVRLSIGIGNMQNNTGKINQSNGDAFVFSGRGLDAIEEKRMVFQSDCEKIDKHINMCFDLFSAVIDRWSIEMCEAVELFLMNKQQVEIAKQIGISQSAVSKRLSHAKADLLEKLLNYYKAVIQETCY